MRIEDTGVLDESNIIVDVGPLGRGKAGVGGFCGYSDSNKFKDCNMVYVKCCNVGIGAGWGIKLVPGASGTLLGGGIGGTFGYVVNNNPSCGVNVRFCGKNDVLVYRSFVTTRVHMGKLVEYSACA